MPFDLMFVRDDDIPDLVQDSLCQLGIVGLNVAMEKQIDMEATKKRCAFTIEQTLDFGQCLLAFAYPENSGYRAIEQLRVRRLLQATHLLFPNT